MNYKEQNNIFDEVQISAHARSLFLNIARWTKFLSILGFILIGLMLIVFTAAIFISGNGEALMGGRNVFGMLGRAGSFLFVLVMLALYLYPTLMLYGYSTKIKRSFNSNNQDDFVSAIKNLKSFFQFFGVLAVLCLVLYGIIIVFAVVMLAAR